MRLLIAIRAAPAGALLALVAGGLGGCISTTTYGTGQSPELAMLSEATGGYLDGTDGEERAQIDYEPRAPLVVPPAAQLPQPAPKPTEVAGANWPTDYDEAAGEERGFIPEEGQTRAMSRDYVRRMGVLGGLLGSRKSEQQRIAERQRRLLERDPAKAFLAQRGDKGREAFSAALAEAEGLSRTERRFLTDPPTDYRQPAEGAPSQFEDIEEKDGNFLERLFSWR